MPEKLLIDLLRPDLLPPRELVTKPLHELVRLDGKVAAVTGGHGPNLGQAIVDRLAGAGAKVAIIHRPQRLEAAQARAKEIAERHGAEVVAVEGDMSDWDSAHRAPELVAERLGGLDIWVNSAGAGRDPAIVVTETETGGFWNFWNVPQAGIDSSLNTLFRTMLYGTHAALGFMVKQGSGRLINIASAAAFNAIKGQVPYSVMKAAVVALTEHVAREAGEHGVAVAAVAPGVLLSEANMPEFSQPSSTDDDWALMEEIFNRTSLGRCHWPEEAANVVAFIASDAGAYIHGTTVRVSGGF
jgi:3-oxoacyl-[acyl-carrier protein] reductase